MVLGILIGLIIGLILNLWTTQSYKRILIMKSQDGTAEYIRGKFYYIREEGK
jgi:hypothetical protein